MEDQLPTVKGRAAWLSALERQIHQALRLRPRLRLEPWSRYLGYAALLLVILLAVWASRLGIDSLSAAPTEAPQVFAQPLSPGALAAAADDALIELPPFEADAEGAVLIARQVELHTQIPSRPRMIIAEYTVKSGDTLFGIAEKYGLKPESVLWGNWFKLDGDPHTLSTGQVLDILPVDGAIHIWSAGEGLNGVASFYGVSTEDIIDWPGNNLDPRLDPANPQIAPGTLLVIPGGVRVLPDWKAPRISRSDPASARVLGPGHCGKVVDGVIGNGVFVWPTATRYLSGYNYNPGLHAGIDIGGKTGYAIFASDAGVIVYAGWNDWGYGNVVVIDHGNGWQTLYAHLSAVNVGCGQEVYTGDVVGAMGSTGNSSGPHLHFEMRHDTYGKVNPLNFLP